MSAMHTTVDETVATTIAVAPVAPVEPIEPATPAKSHASAVGPGQAPRSRAARWHRRIARILLGCLTLQLFFAGLGIFTTTGFLPHAIMGSAIILGSFALPLIAWRGRLRTSLVRRSWLLAALMVLQGLLIDAGRISHVITALHPVNAMLLVLLTFSMV